MIKPCKRCHTPFDAIRAALYCSPTCSGKAHKIASQKASLKWAKAYPEHQREAQRLSKRKHRKTASEEQLEIEREAVRQWRKNNPEKSRQGSRAWYHNNRDRGRKTRKEWREENIEKVRANVHDWRRQHPDRAQQHSASRRALKKNAPVNDLTPEQWEAIKQHYGYRCVYCQRKMKRLSMDHITPLSKGGSHTYTNIVPACRSCNSTKHDGPPPKPVQPLLLID